MDLKETNNSVHESDLIQPEAKPSTIKLHLGDHFRVRSTDNDSTNRKMCFVRFDLFALNFHSVKLGQFSDTWVVLVYEDLG